MASAESLLGAETAATSPLRSAIGYAAEAQKASPAAKAAYACSISFWRERVASRATSATSSATQRGKWFLTALGRLEGSGTVAAHGHQRLQGGHEFILSRG